MKTTYDKALQLVLAHEGGYVNHPKDPGGPTNKGVTQKVYDAYRTLKGLSIRSVKSIMKDEVAEIYDRQYWDRANCDQIPVGLDYAVFDYSVNSGVSRAVKEIQRLVGCVPDGIMGPQTLAAITEAMSGDEEAVITNYCNKRMKFLKGLRTWGTFGKGWSRRVLGIHEGFQEGDDGVIDFAISLARGDLTYPIKKAALPTVIGKKDGEVAGKGVEADQAQMKTTQGAGITVAGVGVTGQTVITAAQQVSPHIDESPIGKLVAVVFGLMMVVGVGLIIYDFWRKQKEKKA